MGFKKLALTTLVLLALKGGYAQSTVDSSKENAPPLIHTFDVKYDPSMVLVNADGEVKWKSRYYKKEGDYIGEIKGEANIDVSFWPFETKVYVGFITRINYNKNTIETITYNNGATDTIIVYGKKVEIDKKLTDYERKIAKREFIDTVLANDVSIEFSDYNLGKLVDLETNKVIDSKSYGLQESYFAAKKKMSKNNGKLEETFKVHLKGNEYNIPVRDSVDQEGNKFLFVDLQVDDSKNPGEKINILKQINRLEIYYDNRVAPKKVIAEVNTGILGITKEITLTIQP